MIKEILIKFLKKFKKQNQVAAHHLRMLENLPGEYFEECESEENDKNAELAGKYVKGIFADKEFAKATLGKNWSKVQSGLTGTMWRKNLKKLEQ